MLKGQAKSGGLIGISAVKAIKAMIKANSKKAAALATMNNLSLPPVLAFRSMMIVLMAMMGIISLGETIIKVGVNIIRLTDEEDWPTQAVNWVAIAKSRPRLEYK
jgi:hypothetical protein